MNLTDKYQHIKFRKHWSFVNDSLFLLGQCEALVRSISNTPILPEKHEGLLELSLMRGAQSTTAIEGNTLSEADILRIRNGERMPPSRAYQETEVRNVLDAFNLLLKEIIAEDHSERITPGLIMRLHKLVGKDLGEHLDAIPGRFRTDNRIVGTYRCPDHEDVPELMENYCRWLLEEFHYPAGQSFAAVVTEAIVAHVYLEWIHPFGDGNGRTGRLLEFYILLRGGLPDIASHILSNHYNDTRPEYYRQLENASRTRDLSEFIHYALQGLRDGLVQVLDVVQESQFSITWQKFIYDRLGSKTYKQRDTYERQRELMLAFPVNKTLLLSDLDLLTPVVAKLYAKVHERTLRRDVEELTALGLLVAEEKGWRVASEQVQGLIARKKFATSPQQ
jgi:Fic family protein